MLDEYLKIIAQKIKSGIKVYLSPAAMETVIIARLLINEYHVMPAGVCDNNINKQGKKLNSIPELKIISFKESLKEETSEFLVVSPHHSASIIGDLIFNQNLPSNKIINFQEVEMCKTCRFFVHNWIIKNRSFYCCCMKDNPVFPHDMTDPKSGVEYLDDLRNKMIDGVYPLPPKCLNCFHNTDSYIYTSRKMNSFNFSFEGWCNYKCEYCSANRPELKNYNAGFVLEEYLIEMEKRSMLNEIFSVLYAVGEPTLNEKRFSLYDYCGKRKYFLDVFSNCSVFDSSLFDLAHKSPVIIRKSFDAGTPETYAKIKGVNCYNKMIDNVRHYLEAPYLALNPKYLFVPGINDNENDINGFVEMCEQMKVDFVTPVFSILDDQFHDSVHAQEMFKYLVDELTKRNIFTARVDTLYSEKYHNLYTKSFGNVVS